MKKIKNLIFSIVIILALSSCCFADVMSEISTAVNKWSTHFGFEPELIYAIIEQESNFNPYAKGASNDRGLMQITPIAQKDAGYENLGDNIYGIDTNIMIGTTYLAKIRDNYVKTNDIAKILARYNGSSTSGAYANSVIAKYNNYKNGTTKIPTSSNVSGTVAANRCTAVGCAGMIVDKIEHTQDTPNAGLHYKVCSVNDKHQFPGVKYKVVNGKCNLCGELLANKTNNSASTTANRCTAVGCGGIIVDKIEHTQDTPNAGLHYKVCSVNKNHQFPGVKYKVVNGKCNQCGEALANKTNNDSGTTTANRCTAVGCGGIIVDKIEHTQDTPNAGLHYKVCSVNDKHQFPGVAYKVVNGKCSECGKQMTVNNQSRMFSDLQNGHWAYNDIKAMKDAGIVFGNPDGTLGVNDKITAEELVVLLGRLVEKKKINLKIGNAYLVDEMGVNKWSYNEYITLIQALGNKCNANEKMGEREVKLILGNSDIDVLNNYKKPITREKVANLMGAILEIKYGDTNASSVNQLGAEDWGKVNSLYKKRINSLVQRGIFRGESRDNSLYINPQVEITRVEAIALINRLYNVL